MKRIFFALFLAFCVFVTLNFIYSNLDEITLNYPIIFKFTVPGFFTLRSQTVPNGFVIISAFSFGIVFLALVQIIPAIFRALGRREGKQKIKELEKQVEALKENSGRLSLAKTEEVSETPDDRLTH
ncbi:MAG: hypothetical protein Q7S00_04485 [bacterium]|nr:hypothetical protein [bacterium]